MKKLIGACLTVLALFAVGGRARADIIELRATLRGANEVPANASTATGTATFLLNTDNPSAPFMTFSATVFGLDFTGSQSSDPNDNLVAAHIIHAGAPPGS